MPGGIVSIRTAVEQVRPGLSPIAYHTLGASAPRTSTRTGYFRRKRRFLINGFTYKSLGIIHPYVSDDWTPTPTWKLAVTMRAVRGTARGRLFDLTTSAEVSGSIVDTTSKTFDVFLSSSFTLTDADKYEFQFGTPIADEGIVRGGDLFGVV